MLLVAIFVAVAGIVLTNAIIRGYQYDMVDDAVMNLTGHVKVLAPGYQEDPSIQKSFSLPSDWKPGVPTSEVEGWTSRINIPAVIMSERETRVFNYSASIRHGNGRSPFSGQLISRETT